MKNEELKIKSLFPIFEKNPGLVYLDSAATALKPNSVIEVMVKYYSEYSGNIHRGLYPISELATEKYDQVREKTAKFIGAQSAEEIVFCSGTTAAINLVARGWGELNLKDGDEIVTTPMEHHSNLVPWLNLANKLNIKINFLAMSNEKLVMSNLNNIISKNTKLLAITHVSNVTGTINPIKEIIKKAREINPKITVLVDGAQAVAHMSVDVLDLDCDFYAFSGHKMYGPTGVGVLYAKAARLKETEPLNFGGGMIGMVSLDKFTIAEGPEGFEGGTPAIAEVIGLGAAIDFIDGLGWKLINESEVRTLKYALSQIKKIEGIRILGRESAENRAGVISIVSRITPGHDLGAYLGSKKFKVAVRAGMHCAQPLHEALGAEYGSCRISLGIYNDESDIDRLVEGIKEVEGIFKKNDKLLMTNVKNI